MRLLFALGMSFLWACGANPTKSALDDEVRRLCAIDGGVRVYETVQLPAKKFNQWGQINFYRPTQGQDALGPEYFFKTTDHFYRDGNPSLVRYHPQIIRRSDNKLLGETVSYGRGGGDLPGPWEPSNFHCPPTSESSEIALFKSVFVPQPKPADD